MSDETSPANANTREDEPLRLDGLLREFYTREMQRGLPRRWNAGSTSNPEGSARTPDVAGRPAGVAASPSMVMRGSVPETAAKRGGTAAVLTAGCTLLMLATLLIGFSRQQAETVATAVRPAGGSEAGSGSVAAAADASSGTAGPLREAAGSRREPVERGGRSRVDARTDGIPVLHGDSESPERPGLEIHVPDEAIEIFPIDEGRRRPVVAPRPASGFQR